MSSGSHISGPLPSVPGPFVRGPFVRGPFVRGPFVRGPFVRGLFVRGLAEVGAADVAHVGGKAASLGELIRAGIPVPAGFVVVADAFSLEPSVLRPVAGVAVDDLSAIAQAAAQVRARITALPVPADVAAQITAAHQALDADLVAVRSSATMEDSADASFAGLQDTYLAVSGTAAVLDAVRRCWASLYNDQSVAYRRRLGLPEDGLGMGVVIQLMVRPRAAGVMFTFGGEHRGNLGAGVRPGGRGGDPRRLHGEQGDRRDHRAPDRRQGPPAFFSAERAGDLLLGHARRSSGSALSYR